MKKRKRRDAAAAEHETTCQQPSNSETKTDRWSDGKIPRGVTDRAGRTGKFWLAKSRTAGVNVCRPGGFAAATWHRIGQHLQDN
ncbi:unnamed protein product [Sphagnum jensenii]|uniref:HNH endonuclease n=1 Tax=Sphagnum jensenii TaxID=128206 RepID=A0ABP1AXN8_9BRYO